MKIEEKNKNLLTLLENLLEINLEKDVVFIKDSNFSYVYANKVFCDLFGVEEEIILGKKDESFIKDKKVLERCLESDKVSYETSFLIHEEELFNKIYRVLKIRINLGGEKNGILCFAKTKKVK